MLTQLKKLAHQFFCKKLFSASEMLFLGTEYGGWHIPKSFHLSANDICYFIGAGEDISFDCAVAMNFPCQIHIFDPTPKAILHFNNLKSAVESNEKFCINNSNEHYIISKEALERISFHPWGVSGSDSKQKFYLPRNSEHVSCSLVNLQKTDTYFFAECFSISSIMNKLHHKEIAFIKLDVEGAEYQVIESMLSDSIKPHLLAIEFDELHTQIDKNYEIRIKNCLSLLKKNQYFLIFKNKSNFTFLLN